MGAAERRSRQREALRGQILAAARQVVLNDGYRALTMRRIAEAVEYSPAAIYQYFENREAIATALMAEGFEQLAAVFEPLAAIADPRARLEAVAQAYVRFGLEHSETYRLMFMEDPHITASMLGAAPKPEDAGARAYGALIGPLAELRERGRLRPQLEVPAVADALWASLHGLVALKLTCPNFPATPTETLMPTLLQTLFEGCLNG
jgi:AcrR family transcriptional regulator